MRKLPLLSVLLTGVLLASILTYTLPASKAQDAAPAPVASPDDVIDQIMQLIGQNKIDDAVALMEGLKTDPDLRQAARESLVHLRENQGTYRGYDVASVQKFTSQFQTVNVLAYYDDQPVLMRFHFYRPQKEDGIKWMVLSFHVITELPDMTELLKDTPVDYVGRK